MTRMLKLNARDSKPMLKNFTSVLKPKVNLIEVKSTSKTKYTCWKPIRSGCALRLHMPHTRHHRAV